MPIRQLELLALLAFALSAPARGQLWEVGEQAVPYTFTTVATAQWGTAIAIGDFDGDGYGDLLVGTPHYDFQTEPPKTDSGTVSSFFGGPDGFGPSSFTYLGGVDQDRLGFAVAAGDFDGDGDDEAVFAEPGWSAVVEQAGSVTVRYWTGAGWLIDTQLSESDDTPGDREPFDHFGASLAVGDFNSDGRDDLAVGIPDENLESPATYLDAGAVTVYYGSPTGLNKAGVQLFVASDAGLGGAQANAHFGFSLAAGDFDGDEYDDLAIGVPFQDLSTEADAGQVVVLYGALGGLTTAGALVFDDTDVGGALGAGDEFGYALAAGDFDRTAACVGAGLCRDDLAIGIPGEPVSGQAHAGGVVVVDGSSTGLAPDIHSTFLSQNLLAASSTAAEPDDRMGSALAAGWLDGRLGDDLAIGVPDEDVEGRADQGVVHLVFGGAGSFYDRPDQEVRQRAGWSGGAGAAGDRFGAAIAIGDLDQRGHGDAAIGLPGRNWSGVSDAGVVQILHGALFADGFETGASSLWSAATP